MATRGKISELYDLEAIKAQQKEAVGLVDGFVQKVSSTKGNINSIYDLENIKAQQKVVIGLVDEFVRKASNIKPIRLSIEGAESSKVISNGIQELGNSVKDYQKIVNDVTNVQVKFNQNMLEQGKMLQNATGSLEENMKLQTQYKVRIAQIQTDLKILSKEYNSLEKNSNKYKNQVSALTQEQLELRNANLEVSATIRNQIKESQAAEGSIDQLQARLTLLQNAYESLSDQERQSPFGVQMKSSIDQLDAAVKNLEGSIGKHQRNVGNYSSAMKIMEKSLVDVKKRIDDYTKSGKANDGVLKSLKEEQALLEKLVKSQAAGFASLTIELRENEKALIEMRKAGLSSSEAYKQLFTEISRAKSELSTFRKEMSTRGNANLYLNATVQAAQALAGAYGIAQGAAALFGEENEELQKTMVKLQAVIAILNGLEAINNALKKESALRTAINIGLQKVAVWQTNLETAAQSKNIVVKYAAIAAQKALNAVMALSAGPALALVGALALLLISLSSFASNTAAAKKSLSQLNTEIAVDQKRFDEYSAAVKRNGEIVIAELESQFASEEKIRKARIQNLRLLQAEASNYLSEYAKAHEDASKSMSDLAAIEDPNKDQKERMKLLGAFLDEYEAFRQKELDLGTQITVAHHNDNKAITEEMIKAQQTEIEILRVGLQSRADVQRRIVDNEEKNYDERIEALKSFQTIQEQLINADAQKQSLTPGQTPEQLKLIEAQRKAAIDQLKKNTDKQEEQLNKERLERERKAQYDITRIQVESKVAANQRIFNDDKKSYEERLDAFNKYFKDQESLIEAEKKFLLEDVKLTAAERQAIEEKAKADLIALEAESGEQIRQLILDNADKEAQRRVDASEKEKNEALEALNERYNSGKISLQQYNQERLRIEQAYSIASLQIEIQNAEKTIQLYKALGFDVSAQERALAELQKKLSDEVTNKKIDDLDKLKSKHKELGNEIVSLVETVSLGAYDKEKNKVQEQINELDRKKLKDIELATTSIQNEKEKAAAIQVINAKAQVQKEALEMRQREIDYQRAKFERMFAMSQTIANTTVAVMSALRSTPPNVPLSIAIGATGAVQLAKLMATPIPKFEDGTENAPGGLAIVGDGKKRELVIEPSGKAYLTPDTDTLMNIPKGSKILPDADQAMNALMLASMSQVGKSLKNAGSINEAHYAKLMTSAIEGKLDKLTNVVKNKKELHIEPGINSVVGIHKYGNKWVYYSGDTYNF